MATFDIGKIPPHWDSLSVQDSFKFGLYNCLQDKMDSSVECMIIGYETHKYVVVENLPVGGRDKVSIQFVGQNHLNENFKKIDRPNKGIFKIPKAGDTVLCVAKGRYQGVEGGKSYNVLGMPIGRVDIWGGDATYDPHYFVVIKSSCEEPGALFWDKVVEDSKTFFASGVLERSINELEEEPSSDINVLKTAELLSRGPSKELSLEQFRELIVDETSVRRIQPAKLINRK